MLGVISLETPQCIWTSFRLEGRTSWIFQICGRWSPLTMGTAGTHSVGLKKGPSPCELRGGPLGIPLLSILGHKTCVESVPDPEDCSPVPTWILGYFWSHPRGVSPRLKWGPARALSSRAVAAVSLFPSRGSRELWLSLEAFPRGFPTRLSHRAVPRATEV